MRDDREIVTKALADEGLSFAPPSLGLARPCYHIFPANSTDECVERPYAHNVDDI